MTPKSRKTALNDLRRLGGVRPKPSDDAPEIWHFGLLSFKARDPREDRAVVLVSATVIEQGLEAALLERFPGLGTDEERLIFEDDGAPLRDFGSKIRLSYALGIIGPKAKADLDLIRQIRNTFAHSRAELTFDVPQVAAACALLTLNERWPNMMGDVNDPREIFIQTAFQYGLYLITDCDKANDPDGPTLRQRILG